MKNVHIGIDPRSLKRRDIVHATRLLKKAAVTRKTRDRIFYKWHAHYDITTLQYRARLDAFTVKLVYI